MWVLILEGLAIGCLLGMTGAGGGILAVPALMASQGWTVAQAAPVGLLAVTLSTWVGTIQGLLKKIVRYRMAIWVAIISIPSAHYGVYLSGILPAKWLTIAFSLVMLVVAYRIFANQNDDLADPPCKINPTTGRLVWNLKTASILGGIGVIAGLLTGLLGVGGGFVIVPALRKASNLDLHSIIATSLMIICLIGGVSIAMHVLQGFHYPLQVSLTFVMAGIVGTIFGRMALNWIAIKTIQNVFATTVLGVASYMLWTACR